MFEKVMPHVPPTLRNMAKQIFRSETHREESRKKIYAARDTKNRIEKNVRYSVMPSTQLDQKSNHNPENWNFKASAVDINSRI